MLGGTLPQEDDPEARFARRIRQNAPTLKGSWEPLSLRQKADLLRPTPAEQKFLSIPWRTDIERARREATASGKPIFLWLMDGDPLGCT